MYICIGYLISAHFLFLFIFVFCFLKLIIQFVIKPYRKIEKSKDNLTGLWLLSVDGNRALNNFRSKFLHTETCQVLCVNFSMTIIFA